MKDFAGSRTTYYSLARERLRGKHPRILNILLVLALISMAGFAAFLLSDIVSFGLNSDHQTFLAGLDPQDSIDNILSMINWSEKSIKSSIESPVAQRGRFNNPQETNTSPVKGDTVRMALNKSGDENSSTSKAVNSSRNAKESNLANSSRTAINQVSSGYTVRSSSGGGSSGKSYNSKKVPSIKMNNGSSSSTSTAQPAKQTDVRGDQKYSNKTQSNSTQSNSTQVNTTQVNATQVNATQVNATQVNATEVSSIQTKNNSRQLQIEEAPPVSSPVYGFSLSQLQADPASTEATPISQSQANVAGVDSSQPNSALNVPEPDAGKTPEDPVMVQSANEKTGEGSDLSERGNKNTAPEISPANPAASVTVSAQDSANEAALPTVAAGSGPAKDAFAGSRTLEIEFKTDSTSPGSENDPSGENTNGETVSNPNTASNPATSESSPVAETKNAENNVSPASKDSTSNSESPALGGGSASVKTPDATVASKSQKLQEIRYQKIANRNRAAENSKKRAIRSRG